MRVIVRLLLNVAVFAATFVCLNLFTSRVLKMLILFFPICVVFTQFHIYVRQRLLSSFSAKTRAVLFKLQIVFAILSLSSFFQASWLPHETWLINFSLSCLFTNIWLAMVLLCFNVIQWRGPLMHPPIEAKLVIAITLLFLAAAVYEGSLEFEINSLEMELKGLKKDLKITVIRLVAVFCFLFRLYLFVVLI